VHIRLTLNSRYALNQDIHSVNTLVYDVQFVVIHVILNSAKQQHVETNGPNVTTIICNLNNVNFHIHCKNKTIRILSRCVPSFEKTKHLLTEIFLRHWILSFWIFNKLLLLYYIILYYIILYYIILYYIILYVKIRFHMSINDPYYWNAFTRMQPI